MRHDPLSATDRAFLDIEDGSLAMHVGAVIVLDGGDLVRPDGGLDAERITRLIAAGVAHIPRFRQHVREVPGLGAVWVDDPHFRLDDHVIHAAIPRPGSRDQLLSLAGRVFGHVLDRRRPLWEMWLVEGLDDGRIAMLVKAHHAMVDGVAGISILAALFRAEPFDDAPESTKLAPVSEPSTLALAQEIVAARASAVASAVRHAPDLVARGRESLSHAGDTAAGALATLRDGVVPADATRINPATVGPHRTFTGVRLDLDRLKRAKRALSGTVNDVALTAVAGALRRYFLRHGDDVSAMRDVRAFVPVNLRGRQGRNADTPGNHVSLVLARLPIHEPDARARFEEVRRVCDHLKHASHEIEAAELVESIGDLGGPNVVYAIFRAAMALRAFNVVVTNVPGPPVPLYCGRSKMESIWGVVPLFAHQGVGIALITYETSMFVGLYADPDAVPDVEALGVDVIAAFDELATAAGV
jgi:WS/DGAT/MGAT family acyltransferase